MGTTHTGVMDAEPTAQNPAQANPAGTTTGIAILKTAAGYRVRPAYVVAGCGSTIRFSNLTREAVDVFVPDAKLFGKQVLDLASEKSLDVMVQSVSAPSRHPYAVFAHAIGDFVAGESSPEIIIDR